MIATLIMSLLIQPTVAGDLLTPAPQAVDNPVRAISEFMAKAGRLLKKSETGRPVQEEQEKALKELEQLIELAQQSQSRSSSSRKQNQNQNQQNQAPQNQPNTGSSTGTNPAAESRDVARPVRSGTGSDAPNINEIWGKLPEAERERILQQINENLPMKYKQMLYLYFKALSEKK